LEEEAAFLAALPSPDRLGAPEALRLAPDGPDPVLAAGRAAARRWFALVEVPLAHGEALREQTPDERTAVARRWEPFEVAPLLDGTALGLEGAATGWLRAEVLQLDDGSFEWTTELAVASAGPWAEVGSGRQQGLLGDQEWDLRAAAEALGGTADPGALTVSTVDADPDTGEPRSGDAILRAGVVVEPWQLAGPDGLGFAHDLALTDDGLTWPGGATVFHATDEGGIAGGVVQQGVEELAFTACWDAAGATRSRTGDPGITPVAGEPCASL
jgi:hypothetical protein